MSNTNCGCRIDCTGTAVVASIIIGIIAAFLNFSAVITITPAFLWVVFGIAVVYLALSFLQKENGCKTFAAGCCCSSYTTFIIGVLGTILTSLILLGITFAATSVIGAIIVGLLLFFFSLLITSTVCILRCASVCYDQCERN